MHPAADSQRKHEAVCGEACQEINNALSLRVQDPFKETEMHLLVSCLNALKIMPGC